MTKKRAIISLLVVSVLTVCLLCDFREGFQSLWTTDRRQQIIISLHGDEFRQSTTRATKKDLIRMLPSITKPADVDCFKVFSANKEAINTAAEVNDVIQIPDGDYLSLTRNCTEYRSSGYLTEPVSREEAEFPIAYIIQIYKDIVQIERLLKAIYRPQNWYCINVDLSSEEATHQAMIAIASCFDNVIISNKDVTWAHFSQIEADLMCMQLLYNKNREWKYLLTLAGQMFPMKTNLDIVRILKALNGSNSVMAITKRRNLNRWDFLPPPPINVTLVKGGCNFAVTRAFVEYVLFDPRVQLFKNWTRQTRFPDEHFFQSLSHSPQLNVPGAYTGWPETGENGYDQVMRLAIWHDHNSTCHGKFVRSVCIFGVADLPAIGRDYHLFLNKFYYDYQPMTMTCMEERHYNMTREDILGLGADRLNITFYRTLPNVKNHIPSGLERQEAGD